MSNVFLNAKYNEPLALLFIVTNIRVHIGYSVAASALFIYSHTTSLTYFQRVGHHSHYFVRWDCHGTANQASDSELIVAIGTRNVLLEYPLRGARTSALRYPSAQLPLLIEVPGTRVVWSDFTIVQTQH